MKKIIALCLFSLLTLFPFWVPTITDSFQAAGQAVSATSVVNPSAVLDLGASIASKMTLSLGYLGFLVNPVGVLIGSFAVFFVVVAFALIAAQLCLTLIETYIVLSGGALFLGFAGFRPTAFLAEGYLLYAFQVGAKIYLLYLLMAAGMGIARHWQTLDFSPGFGAGPPTLEQMIASTGRGLLLTCLWYIREVDPQTLLLTGLTRDGVYLVENGEVVGAVNNFRFNESPVTMLGRLLEVGTTVPTLPREWGDYFNRAAMPPVRVEGFNMSSVSQAS